MKPEGHTETPWKYEADTERVVGDRHEIVCWMKSSAANPGKAKANGEAIVTAVNSHAALQQANERMRKALEGVLRFTRKGEEEDWEAIEKQIHAALAETRE